MGDIWDDDFDWGTPPEGAAPAPSPAPSGGGGEAAAPAAPGVKSQTSMPAWFQQWFQGEWQKPGAGKNWFQGAQNLKDTYDTTFKGGPRYRKQQDDIMGAMPEALTNYRQLPGLIENKRKGMIDQLYASLPQMQTLYQPVMEGMSRRGILNSDVTGKALGDVQNEVNRQVMSKTADANTWAAGENINQATNFPTILSNMVATILGANKGEADFGTQGAAIGGKQQDLVSEMLKMLNQSTTYNV